MEEKFFFMYHLRQKPEVAMSFPIFERKWFIERFIQQKEKENEAIEAAKQKSKRH
ncbi:MAG: hypothetical protein M0R80_02920 [Proteobacteria bacterium]|jgi:hypothetical protein|nr:hypothetical protein [Pseudomonadota bacterium]